MKRGTSWYVGLALFASFLVTVVYLFYFRGYVSVLSGDSSSFLIELARTQARIHSDADVLVLGNSTASEGFLANFFNARAPGHTALNLGIPGGNIYLFDRMVTVAADEGVRPRFIALMLTPDIVSDRPEFNFLRNDLTVLKTVLDGRDLATLAGYSRDLRDYAELAVPVALRPVLYRAELRDFFAHPVERIDNARKVHEYLAGFRRNSPMPEMNRPFAVCDAGPLNQLSETLDRLRRERSPLLPDVERVQAGYGVMRQQHYAVDAFRVERLRRLLQRLGKTGAAVYVVESPYYDPDFGQYPADYRRDFTSTLRAITQSVPRVMLLPKFESDCTMMMDTLHLNRKGGELFTEYLRTRVF